MGINCFCWAEEYAYCPCRKYLCSDSRLSMASTSHWLGCSKRKPWHEDSWGPLKALAVASAINGIGDIVLCSVLGYGIAGAAWATMASQVVAGYMMMAALNKKGYNAFTISVPSADELLSILVLAAPVFVTMISKVMVQTFCMCTVWSEPLSQTAQSFMPGLIYGVNRSLEKLNYSQDVLVSKQARTLLKSLVIIGCIVGIILGSIGTFVPWKFPNIFTPDQNVIQEMHKVLIPYFMALVITTPTLSLEGTLLAGRDLRFISASMSGCFTLGSLLLLLVSSKGLGLAGCWYALSGFQWARFFLALRRLTSAHSVLYTEDLSRFKVQKLKAT
ncbi:hypothetical protein EUGRSUZ_I01313 [Eucalyptus grandis]|uniref:Uncharacterized protein n=2 Tax=Eucalyptus grandis TaxID=71139 RepID=A0ACC3JEB5_EUCGR|nr:hypothetical protein EUGRSUZ_I01313 [Eucalyptus grandis]